MYGITTFLKVIRIYVVKLLFANTIRTSRSDCWQVSSSFPVCAHSFFEVVPFFDFDVICRLQAFPSSASLSVYVSLHSTRRQTVSSHVKSKPVHVSFRVALNIALFSPIFLLLIFQLRS